MDKDYFIQQCLQKFNCFTSTNLLVIWEDLGALYISLFEKRKNDGLSRKQLNFQVSWYSTLGKELEKFHLKYCAQETLQNFTKAFHFAANLVYCHHASQQKNRSNATATTSSSNVSLCESESTDSLLLLGGGTLALVRKHFQKRAVKAKKLFKHDQFASYNRLLTLVKLFTMSHKEKKALFKRLGESFVMYKDRGFLFIPKTCFLPFIRCLNDLVVSKTYNYDHVISSHELSACMQASSDQNSQLQCLFEKSAKKCLKNGQLMDKEVLTSFFSLWRDKFIHARYGSMFSSKILLNVEKSGKMINGAHSLRDVLYQSVNKRKC